MRAVRTLMQMSAHNNQPRATPEELMRSESRAQWPGIKVLVASLLVMAALAASLFAWRSGFMHYAFSTEHLVAMLRVDGPRGAFLCIAIQFLHVVTVLPGEITQPAAGYVFGLWRGFVYSTIGIVLGSVFNFYLARALGRPALERLVKRETLQKVDRLLLGAKGKSALFLLFLVPGAPKDAMCYGAGFSRMRPSEFIWIAVLGRAPALFGSVLIGARAADRDYKAVILVTVVLLLAVAGFFLYERYRCRREQQRSNV